MQRLLTAFVTTYRKLMEDRLKMLQMGVRLTCKISDLNSRRSSCPGRSPLFTALPPTSGLKSCIPCVSSTFCDNDSMNVTSSRPTQEGFFFLTWHHIFLRSVFANLSALVLSSLGGRPSPLHLGSFLFPSCSEFQVCRHRRPLSFSLDHWLLN